MGKMNIPGQLTLGEMLLPNILNVGDRPFWDKQDWDDPKHKVHIGKMIKFTDLKNYIGRKVWIERPMQSRTDYQCVMITSYHENADHSYKRNNKTGEYEIEHTYDRIGYLDDKRKHKENSWVGEISCKNGRFEVLHPYPECFYEIEATGLL